jgi:hypothetical protein
MRAALVVVLLIYSTVSAGQSVVDTTKGRNIFSLGLRTHAGYFLKHSSSLGPIKDSYPWGFEADLAWQMTSDKAYSYCSCYPRVGVSVVYMNFDNGPVLGSAYYALAYVEPVFFVPKRFNLSFRIALVGVAFMDRPYNEVSNPNNQAYSTHVAFPLALGVGFNYRIDPHWNIRLGGNFNHISNGGVKNPNAGLNWPTAHLGFDYSFKPVELKGKGRVRRPPPEKKNRMELDIGNSLKNPTPREPNLSWILNTNLQYSRWLHRSTAIAVGTYFEMDNSRRVKIRRSDDPTRSHLRLSFSVGHEFWLGKVQFGQHIGVYAFDDFPVDQIWFHRHELTFQILPYLYASFGLKAHNQVADYLDLKIGTNLNW